MDTSRRGGHPKIIAEFCEVPGCSRAGRTRYPAPTRLQPNPPTYCDACRKKLERASAFECSSPGCRRLRQWNKLNANRNGYCREHERDYLEHNPKAVRRALERIMGHVDVVGGCWVWRLTPDQASRGERPRVHVGYSWKVYRFLYVLVVGTLPTNMTLDHLCGHRNCVAVHHLEPVSLRENKRRQSERALGTRNRKDDIDEYAEGLLEDPEVNHELLKLFVRIPGSDAGDAFVAQAGLIRYRERQIVPRSGAVLSKAFYERD